MDKKTGHILSAAVAVAVVGGLYWSNATLRDKVEQLSDQVTSLNSQLSSIRYDLSDEISALRQELDTQNSLFSAVETNLGYENGRLALHVTVVPKELSAEEAASVSLSTGENAVLSDDGSGRFTGVLTCPLRETLEPVVSLAAGQHTRREALPTLWAEDFLKQNGQCDWMMEGSSTSDVLSIAFEPGKDNIFTVTSVSIAVRSGILDPANEGSLLGTVAARQQSDGSWAADLSNYLSAAGEYDYDFWLTAATEEGVTLSSRDPISDCQQSAARSNTRSAGGFELIPAFSPF